MKYNEIIKLLRKTIYWKEYQEYVDDDYKYLSYNSNDVKPNTLFFCKGANFKEEYLKNSIEKGITGYVSEQKYNVDIPGIIVNDVIKAMGIISKSFYDDPKKINLIGITGTKGKTTSLYFALNVLNENNNKITAYHSTMENYTGTDIRVSRNTTPESLNIYRNIKEAKDNNIENYVMEISSSASKYDRIYTIDFDYGIFTNLGLDHISDVEHKTYEEYRDCKVDFLKQCKNVIINKQTKDFDYILDKIKDKRIITFGSTKDCDYYYDNITKKDHFTSFDLHHGDEVRNYTISMLGEFNILNAIPSIILGKEMNIEDKYIYSGVLNTQVKGRMNIYNNFICPIIVDYAHNYVSIENLMQAIDEYYGSKNKILVFGNTGNTATNRRKEYAELANKFAKYVYLTTDNPQNVPVEEICKEVAAMLEVPNETIIDREEAITTAMNNATNEDILAIISKGSENYQLINGKYIPYKTDGKIVEEHIRKLAKKS